MAWELPSLNCMLDYLKARRWRKRRRQGKEEPKKTAKAIMKELMMQPPARSLRRARQAQQTPFNILSYTHYIPNYTPSNILSYNHSICG